MIHRNLLMATAILASVAITACSDTTAPKTLASGLPAVASNNQQGDQDESPRSGALHVTKECSQYTRLAGGFCTITSSNLRQIEVGTKVVYELASGPTVLDTDVRLVPPGSGKSVAFGHVVLDLVALRGAVTLSGGTGKFKRLHASAVVTHLTGRNWAWDGTYSFSDDD
jgi:hypothetical protein